MWTLAWSVVALYITYSNTKFKDWQKTLLILLICLITFSALSYEVLKLYDGTREKSKTMKWFFYMYYPLHLLIIGILRILIYGNVTILFI